MPANIQFYSYAAILAVLSWWLLELTGSDETPSRVLNKSHTPEYFSAGYIKWEMDEAGKLKSKLIAKTMTHYGDDGTTHLQTPALTLVNKEAPPWIIQSETGIVSADGKQILLEGKAVVEREGAPGFSPLKINSSNLRVKPEQNYAETDDWAELLSPPNRTEGIGMQLKYGDPIHIKLFSKVRGKYELK
ncbi:MAG: LPS export ABC transporter periplasmic protein LptC [Gammaproteobacteria bacterium]